MDRTTCLIAGGGPAGIVLGRLPARAGVEVTVLEKHADFLRDFRGDTVHPTTLDLLDELGLGERFAKLPQRRLTSVQLPIRGHMFTIADLTVACDGRNGTGPSGAVGFLTPRRVALLFDRGDYWQCATLRERGVTVLIIGHDLAQVMRVCDNVVVPRRGRSVAAHPISEAGGDRLVGLVTGAIAGNLEVPQNGDVGVGDNATACETARTSSTTSEAAS